MLDAVRLRVLVAVARHGSVTEAARAMNYAQPSISHHIARLEAETGAKLMERAGRGVKLTDAGQLLAKRAEEILGRLDAAEAELAAHVGLKRERVRLAAFGSALSALVPPTASALRRQRPGTDVVAIQAEPTDALRMLRAGEVDVALVFQYAHNGELLPGGDDRGFRLTQDQRDAESLRFQLVLDEPVYLIAPLGLDFETNQPGVAVVAGTDLLAACSHHRWIAGCQRCKDSLVRLCHRAGFAPDIAVSTDDYVAAQALVATGLGVAIMPGLALRAAGNSAVSSTELAGIRRQIVAVSYGGAPERPRGGTDARAPDDPERPRGGTDARAPDDTDLSGSAHMIRQLIATGAS